jgi:phage terminase large subunit-like protein
MARHGANLGCAFGGRLADTPAASSIAASRLTAVTSTPRAPPPVSLPDNGGRVLASGVDGQLRAEPPREVELGVVEVDGRDAQVDLLTFTSLEGMSEVVTGFLPTEMRPNAGFQRSMGPR